MPMDISKLPALSKVRLASGVVVTAAHYIRLRDMVVAKCGPYMYEPHPKASHNLQEFLDNVTAIALYCEEHRIDYDVQNVKYGAPALIQGSDDPWEYSKEFERTYGIPMRDVTGQLPISIL